VVLDDTSDPSDITPHLPTDWIGTRNAGGSLLASVNATDVMSQDFGLWHGGRIDGSVFRDDGAAGGVANDGTRQSNEALLSGRRVRLMSAACAGGACDSMLTDASGAFTLWFPYTAAGPVGVQATNASGWLSTGAQPGTSLGSYDRAADLIAFTASSGVVVSGVAFGDVPPHLWVAPSAGECRAARPRSIATRSPPAAARP
jgi:hypothetical protein